MATLAEKGGSIVGSVEIQAAMVVADSQSGQFQGSERVGSE